MNKLCLRISIGLGTLSFVLFLLVPVASIINDDPQPLLWVVAPAWALMYLCVLGIGKYMVTMPPGIIAEMLPAGFADFISQYLRVMGHAVVIVAPLITCIISGMTLIAVSMERSS